MLILHDGTIHTLEARRAQIDNILERNPDIVITGSVARAAVLGYNMPTVKERSYVRDIDVLSCGKGDFSLDGEESTEPFPVDITLKNLITKDCGMVTVRYREDRPDVAVKLPIELFEPYVAKMPNGNIQTLHPDTLLNIHRIIGTYNPRVWKNIAEFRKGLSRISYPKISSSAFDPLAELHRMAMKDPELRNQKMIEQIMALYDYFAPAYVRSALKPLAVVALKSVGVQSRNGTIVTRR